MVQRVWIAIGALSVAVLLGGSLTFFHSKSALHSPLLTADLSKTVVSTFFKEKGFEIRSVVPSPQSSEKALEYWITVQADIRFSGTKRTGHNSMDQYQWSLFDPAGKKLFILGAKSNSVESYATQCERGATCVFVWKPQGDLNRLQDLELRIFSAQERTEKAVPLKNLRMPASLKDLQFRALKNEIQIQVGQEVELPLSCSRVESLQLKAPDGFLSYRVEGLSTDQDCHVWVKPLKAETYPIVLKATNLNAAPSQILTEFHIDAKLTF